VYRLGGQHAVANAVTIDLDPDERGALVKLDTTSREEISSLRQRIAGLGHTTGEIDAECRSLKRQLAGLSADTCSACGQAIPEALRGHLGVLLDRATLGAADERKRVQEASRAITAELEEAEEERAGIQEKLRAWDQRAAEQKRAYQEAARYAEQYAHLTIAVAKACVTVTDLERRFDTAQEAANLATRELLVLEAAERVLGLNGVRANVLGRALGGIEQVANGWLARLRRPDFLVRLKPYTEKKSGGVNDAISLQVEGAGGGYGYRAASAGERCRIDVALLLALGEIAGAARGLGAGSLFCDEIGDGLDADGQDALAEVLAGLAQTRCVLVISHSERFQRCLQAVERWSVDRGKVTRSGQG